MPTPHIHAAVIKAWADGYPIQFRDSDCEGWRNANGTPMWLEHYEYRVNPEVIKYRTFLWRTSDGRAAVCVTDKASDEVEPRENWSGFIRWLSPWQEAAV